MDVLKLFTWEQSLEAIKQLEGLLECSLCGKVAEEAQSLGRCEHFFCATCVLLLENGNCNKCKIPGTASEVKPDRIIAGLVSSVNDLKCLLNGGEVKCLDSGIEAPQQPSTPEAQIRPANPLRALSTNPSDKNVSRNGVKSETKSGGSTDMKKMKQKTEKPTSKTHKDSSDDNKPKKKAKSTSVGQNGAKSIAEANKSFPRTEVKGVPVTPDMKRTMKVPNLSVLGLSPKTLAINKRNTKGETALHVACIKGDVGKVKSMLQEGANPNTKDNAGWTPLHEACSHGFLNIAELLLQHGALVDVPGDSNENPLHDAVTQGRVDIIKLLRSWGASDTARNLYGHTPRSLLSFCEGIEELTSALDTTLNTSLKIPTPKIPYKEKLALLSSGLAQNHLKDVDRLAKLIRARVLSEFSPEVTHIIAECGENSQTCERTIKYMMGVVSGKWIVSRKWMQECLSQELAVNPASYEVQGSIKDPNSGAPARGRRNADKMLPGLFNGCHMYLWGSFRDPYPSKKDIEALIKAGGGVVLIREPNPEAISESEQTVPFHSDPMGSLARCSHYIIYQEGISEPQIKYDMPHVKTLPFSWLTQCIDQFKLSLHFK